MRSRLPLPFLAILFVCSISLSAVADNIVVNGSFADGLATSDFPGWTTSNTAFALAVPDGFDGYVSQDGDGAFAAFGDFGCSPCGSLSQNLTDVAGKTYTFSFYLASDGSGTADFPAYFEADWNGTTLLALSNPAATGGSPYPYVQYSFKVTGTGSDSITFLEEDDFGYLALDNVCVTADGTCPTGPPPPPPPPPTSTPEPGSFMLVAGGVAALGQGIRRRLLK